MQYGFFLNAMEKDSPVSLRHLQTLRSAPALPWDARAHPSGTGAGPSDPIRKGLRGAGFAFPSPHAAFGKAVGEGKQPSSLVLHLRI